MGFGELGSGLGKLGSGGLGGWGQGLGWEVGVRGIEVGDIGVRGVNWDQESWCRGELGSKELE